MLRTTEPAERAECARRAAIALDCERLGHPREAWGVWERLRADYPQSDAWNAPLVASYLGFALDWTADSEAGSVEEVLEALSRAIAILAGDLARDEDDLGRWLLAARALEQRCVLFAFGADWTEAARASLELCHAAGLPEPQGDPRLVGAAAGAAEALIAMLEGRPDLPLLVRDRLAEARERIGLVRARLHAGRRGPNGRPKFRVVDGGKSAAAGDSAEGRGHRRTG